MSFAKYVNEIEGNQSVRTEKKNQQELVFVCTLFWRKEEKKLKSSNMTTVLILLFTAAALCCVCFQSPPQVSNQTKTNDMEKALAAMRRGETLFMKL